MFVYDWNVAKDTITDYYRRQYPDGWVKVMPFSLRNILYAIKNLDHRLYRYEGQGQQSNVNIPVSVLNGCGPQQQQFTALSTVPAPSPIVGSNGSLNSLSSTGSFSSASSSNYHVEARQQHQVVFLLTGSMNLEYGVFGPMQKMILKAIKNALPERVRGVNFIGHCMYGCACCSGAEHKVPLYFTRYFRKT